MNRDRHRMLRRFPRRWRSRYGEEFLSLLDDLSPDMPISVGERREARRVGHDIRRSQFRSASRGIAVALVLVAATVGLGVGLRRPPPGQPSAVTLRSAYGQLPDLATGYLPECGSSAALASGAEVVGTDRPAGFLGSTLPSLPSKKVASGTLTRSFVGPGAAESSARWSVWSVGRFAGPSAVTDGLIDGNLVFENHWYSFCGGDSYGQQVPGPPHGHLFGGYLPGLTSIQIANWFPGGIIFGFMPAGVTTLDLFGPDGLLPIRKVRTVGDLGIFIAQLPPSSCSWSYVELTQGRVVGYGSFKPSGDTPGAQACSTSVPLASAQFDVVPLQAG